MGGWIGGLALVVIGLHAPAVAEDEAPVAAEDESQSPVTPVTTVYAQVCAACHGAKGEGNEVVKSPSIAGMPAWYVELQLEKFRSGMRGAHTEDAQGQIMRAIALSLTEEQVKEAAETVSQMTAIPTVQPDEGTDLTKGRFLFANVCMACHRYNGTGEQAFSSPPLVRLNRTYIRRQLENYQEGIRGATREDFYGGKMVEVTSELSAEELDALVDYIGALAHGDDPRIAWER